MTAELQGFTREDLPAADGIVRYRALLQTFRLPISQPTEHTTTTLVVCHLYSLQTSLVQRNYIVDRCPLQVVCSLSLIPLSFHV